MLYPQEPTAPDYDIFRSMEKVDETGLSHVEFAVDIDTGSQADADRIHEILKGAAGDVFDVHHSGNKGFHIQLPFSKWKYSFPEWPATFRFLAENLDMLGVIDTSIFKRNAMFRVDGSLNSKSGKHKTLLHAGTLDAPAGEWAALVQQAEQRALNEPSRRVSLPTASGGGSGDAEPFKLLRDYMPPCIQSLWLDGIPAPGTRHATYLHLISYHYRRGDSEDECLENLKVFAEEGVNTKTPLSARLSEVERLTSLAYRHGLTFECARAQDIGVCDESCKLFPNT